MHISFVSVAINKSSTYCRTFPIPCGRSHCSRSLASWFPKRVGLFLNPWGSTVHVNCIFLPDSMFSHSNANNNWLSELKGKQKKASFRSSTVNQANSGTNLINNVYGFATTGCRSPPLLLLYTLYALSNKISKFLLSGSFSFCNFFRMSCADCPKNNDTNCCIPTSDPGSKGVSPHGIPQPIQEFWWSIFRSLPNGV